ncbi:MAG: alpha/beta hydrolase [Chthoniobacterales bacterium]|nr:alpha/beta hydrolase [Chthoniobacterales bacterium]
MNGNFRSWTAFAAALASCVNCAVAADGDLSVFLKPRFANVVMNNAVKFADVVDYKGRPTELFVDVYQPEGDPATNRPVVMLVHGGGFRTSGVRTQKYIVHFANELARRGFVAVSVDYRQRDGKDMPTPADELPALKDAAADALTALQWVRQHGADYGYDPEKIFVAGGSAGGRITAALACRENGDTGGLPMTDKFSTTEPPSSVTSESGADYNRKGLIAAAIFWGGPEPEFRCFTVDGGDLPCVLIHGTYDSTVPADGSASLHDKLARSGVPTRLHFLNGYEHSLKETADASADAKPQAAQWMAEFFVQQWQRKLACTPASAAVARIDLPFGGTSELQPPVSCQGGQVSWQWKLDGHDLPGATNRVFSIASASPSDAGFYEVAVSNPIGGWPTAEVSSLTIDHAPISSVQFDQAEGKSSHPAALVVPVAQVGVSTTATLHEESAK